MVFFETLLTVATEKVGEKLLAGIGAKLNPDDVEAFLKQAIAAAKATEPALFFAFQEDGLRGYGRFLNGFFKGRALSELQKPLKENQGCPDVDYLTEALRQEATQHSKLKALDEAKIRPWMQAFVGTYFQATSRALQFQVIRTDYCDQICRVFDDVKFAGIAVDGQDIDRAERLADIFVMPDVQESESERQPVALDRLPEIETETPQQRLLWEQQQAILADRDHSSGRQFSAAELLTDGKTTRAVLLGAPGSGKSTLMSYFAVAGAACHAKEVKHSVGDFQAASTRLPIIIRIRDLARHPDRSILEFIQEFTEKDLVVTRNLTGFFEYYLENGSALILLDGLDEVADVAQRYRVVEKIEAFLGQFDQCPAIITSRPAGYKRDFFRTDEYPHYELQLFDDEKIDTFIEHWYDSRFELQSERERRKTSLRKALQDQPRIKQLARNPLLLTIIALIHRYQAKLPKERHKLYDKAVETLLTTWDSQRELSHHEILEYLELDDLRRLMERLAYWIHCQGGVGDTEGGTLIDRDELVVQLTKYIGEMKQVERHQARAEAKRFLEHIVRDRAGLLSLQGQDRYAFVHKTFQEYLTAMEIRDRQEEGFDVVLEHVEEHLHNPHWEEVLLLLISQQKRNNPAKVLKAILAHDTPYESWLHRNLLFAGNVLGENVPVADGELVRSILQRLMDLEASQSPLVTQTLRSRVLRAIGDLYETAFEQVALTELRDYSTSLDRWRFLEYQGKLAPEKTALELVALLNDSDSNVRYSAAEALGKLGQGLDAVVGGLLNLLNDSDSNVRYSAAEALGKLGQGSDAVVGGLLNLLNDRYSNVRSRAAETLGKLGQGLDAVVGSLLNLLNDSNFLVR
ncbi:MAG: HEAT repeat domain-containing protein, partial [Cyanobacteria bacterium P01_A01_bin.135]